MTNERILFRLRVSAECWFFRETCVRPRFVKRYVSRVLSSGRAPQSLLLLRRRSACASSHEYARSHGSDMWIYSSARFRAARPSLASRAVFLSTTVELRTLGCAI